MSLTYKKYLAIALALAVLCVLAVLWQRPQGALGSVAVSNGYRATTTPAVADETNLCPPLPFTASSSTGILGSVNILLTGGGTITIYDATTTNINFRSADQATSSLRIADFPASPTVGSYHFDAVFRRGLLVDYTTTGTGPASSTISYRCNE
jgi:hypothetical protein